MSTDMYQLAASWQIILPISCTLELDADEETSIISTTLLAILVLLRTIFAEPLVLARHDMLPKNLSAWLRNECVRRFISSQASAQRNDRFSVVIDGSVSKRAVIDHVSTKLQAGNFMGGSSLVSRAPLDATVILASQDFASWLEDESFVSALLPSLFPRSRQDEATRRDFSILSAVVDGLCPVAPGGVPGRGFSILNGHLDSILPGMWPSSLSHKFAPDGSDIRASLDFTLGPLLDSANPIAVTVPLANTVFQNGRQSTLLAGLWARSEKGSFKLSSLEERHTQLVVPSRSNSALTSSVSIPLIPITAPRKVLAGLGNIIRQVEADGLPSPASKELERDIPRLLKAREKASAAEITGPLGVWTLVVPESLATPGLLAEISATPVLEIEAERAASAKFSRLLPELVASGCHIHRILSGGGGWGLKQGLLSLDPQTSYSPPGGAEDVESFIRSFRGDDTADSIVAPGCYVQFLVAPVSVEIPNAESTRQSSAAMFGVHEGAGLLEPSQQGDGSVKFLPGVFGAVSSHGIFLSSSPGSTQYQVASPEIKTKIDVPNSAVWEST
ncbi:V-type c subunit family protein [Pleurostoma richardsiae]|uniref:V-type c subunit family protein n=1 Tax=Pleurostoma richardsiae TaxID=41990 RepID=A0AA38RWD9_9PEZI|nr:V-type c subunit family protein [Pleurostoma richardsiae]